jgi:2-keto-4-pentenoate hydratase/2-oxohepta-3-ene-1,7-dioic acid hydratase in catechol pathway
MSINVARSSHGWWVEAHGRLTPIATDATTTAELLADRSVIEQAAASPDTEGPLTAEVQLLSPVTTPARIVAQMVNYRSHARESGLDPDSVPPTFFRKASGSVTAPSGSIVRPSHVRFLDYEIELGLVLGNTLAIGDSVTAERLPDYVAGVVVTNDVSAREIQLTRTQFYESKSYPTFTPIGPFLTLLERHEFAALEDLHLVLTVNGEVRQDSTLSDMIVKPAQALTLLARFQTLEAGDVLLTGTPGGTALKAPSKIAEKIAALLPPAVKWRLFFKGQESNSRYLRDGDLVSASISDPNSGISLGTQHLTVHAQELT